MREAGKDWLVDLLGREQEGTGEFARRMHRVQDIGKVITQNAGKRAWQSRWHWEH